MHVLKPYYFPFKLSSAPPLMDLILYLVFVLLPLFVKVWEESQQLRRGRHPLTLKEDEIPQLGRTGSSLGGRSLTIHINNTWNPDTVK